METRDSGYFGHTSHRTKTNKKQSETNNKTKSKKSPAQHSKLRR